MYRNRLRLLPGLLTLLLTLGASAQTSNVPSPPSGDAGKTQAEQQPKQGPKLELDDEYQKFDTELTKVNEALSKLEEKASDKRTLLESTRKICEDGKKRIDQYRLLRLERIGKPYDLSHLEVPEAKDLSLPESLRQFAWNMTREQRQSALTELERMRRLIENEMQRLQKYQRDLQSEEQSVDRELIVAESRNETKIQKEQEAAQLALKKANEALDASPKPTGEILQNLSMSKLLQEVSLAVLDRESRRRKDWIAWLEGARARIKAAILESKEGLLKTYQDDAAAVDQRLSEFKVYELPAVVLPEGLDLPAPQEAQIKKALEVQRARIEELIRKTAEARTLQRKLEGELVTIQSVAGDTTALITKQLERTSIASNESSSIRSFRLQMAIKSLEREIDKPILSTLTWQEMHTQQRRLARQIDELMLSIEEIRDRATTDLQVAWGSPDATIPAKLAEYGDGWSRREEKESRSLLDVTEKAFNHVLAIVRNMQERQDALLAGIRTLEERGAFLADPQRLTLRGQSFGSLVSEMGQVARALVALPRSIHDAALDRDPGAAVPAWRLYLALLALCSAGAVSFWLRGRAARMRRSILAGEETDRTQVLRLTLVAWVYRLMPWFAIGLFLFYAATFFPPISQESRLSEATGKFFLYASFWIVTSRVFLRPSNPRLRFFLIDDAHARRLYRIVTFGLIFWLLGLVGEMMGALLSGYHGRIFQAALQAIRDGGLLLMAYLFFNRKAFLEDIFPATTEGGLRFLQGFVLTALWPIRIALVVSIGAWLLTYYDLAHALGLRIMGGFGSLLLAVAFYQIVKNEINDRLLLRRFQVDEATIADLTEEEKDALTTDRAKVSRLASSYVEILVFLVSVTLFLGSVVWFYGIGWSGLDKLMAAHLWGSDMLKTEVTVGDFLGFLLAVFLTLALTRRSGPTIDYILEKRTVIDRGMRYTMGTLCAYIVFLAGMGLAFSRLNIGFAQVSWIIAALGVGIGFGLQDIVSNFFSGLILLFERPLRVGDIVKVGDTLGEVKKITIRSTTVTSFDNIDVIVPNKDFISSSITNWTASDRDLRSTIDVGVAYGSDLKRVRQVLADTVSKHGRVYKKPAPSIFVKAFGESSIDFAVVYWTALDFKRSTFSDLHFAIEAAFGREGITIPFPQRDVNFYPVRDIPVVLQGENDSNGSARGSRAAKKKEGDAVPDAALEEPSSESRGRHNEEVDLGSDGSGAAVGGSEGDL